MDERECQAVYQQLVSMLREIEMDWVVQLAAEEISTGKILTTKSRSRTAQQLNIFSESEENSRTSKKGTPDIEVREYTPKEKLKILINYIEQAIVDSTLMGSEIIYFFSKENIFFNFNNHITFRAETDEENNLFILTNDGLNERVEQAKTLYRLLDELKREIGNDT